jgi:hypothetical protein
MTEMLSTAMAAQRLALWRLPLDGAVLEDQALPRIHANYVVMVSVKEVRHVMMAITLTATGVTPCAL